MIVFLIIVAVLAVSTMGVMSLSATFTVIYDKGWKTTVKVLFFEMEISISELLSKLLLPGKKTEDEEEKKPEEEKKTDKPKKTNPIKKMWDEEGIVGILSFASDMIESANSLVLSLIRGLHIYSLYVMIIVGGNDAAQIAQSYGAICARYYPVKGFILSSMQVDNFDEVIYPDFIAPCNEYEFQFIGSISVGALFNAALKAGTVFVKNLINNKKENKKV